MQHSLDFARGLQLRDILTRSRFIGGSDVPVDSCCSDWRCCRPGDIYVALVTSEGDGHDDVDRAIQRGAIAVVAERLLPVSVPCCLVPDSREAYGQICQHLAGQPDQHLRTVGVTGTHGKTTTAVLVASVLQAAERQVGVMSSLGYCDTEQIAGASMTTPPPPELARWLSRMMANGCSDAVVEVSSEALAARHLSGLEFDAAVLTNIGLDRRNLHGSSKNYHRLKRRLFQQLKPSGFAVVNADDPASMQLAQAVDAPQITVGMYEAAELQAHLVERFASEQTFLLNAGQESIPVRTRTIGDAYIYYCLLAAAVGLVKGIDLATIVRGLESVEPLPGRLERVECGQDFGVFIDQARSADQLSNSLRTLRQVTDGKLICVYSACDWLTSEQRAALGRVAEKGADFGIITNAIKNDDSSLQVAHDVLDGYRRPASAHLLPDRARAIHWAIQAAQPGDTILVAGEGETLHPQKESEAWPANDRQIAQDWLYGNEPDPPKVTSTAILPFPQHCHWN
jgi:UDP-N-acetylmuramoyl-L-alanyl-D-glutamate--2,6-diaminopimelate ligase